MTWRGRSCSRLYSSAVLALVLCAHAAHAEDDSTRLLARGDCTGASRAAWKSVADADAKRGAQSATAATALAEFTRIVLECHRPDAPGLDDALQRELVLRERLSGAQSAAAAQVKLQQAKRAAQRNRIDDAFALTQAIRDQAQFATWSPTLRASVLTQLAVIYNMRADAPPAIENAAAALVLARSEPKPDAAIVIAALQEQGFALTRMRQGAKALLPLAEAEVLAREHFGSTSRAHAETLRFLAYAKRDAGDFGGAIGAFEQALAIQSAQVEIDEHQIAVLLLNLGQTLKISGDSARALERYEAALDADARAPDPAARTRPAILHGLANLYRDRDDNSKAVTLYAQAVPLFASAFGEHSVQLAQVLNNYANAEGNLKHYDSAILLYERALAIAYERNSADPADYIALSNIAMMRVWQGRYAEAEPAFRETLRRMHGVAAGGEAGLLFAQIGLAASLWGQGRLDDAFAAAVAAEQLRQSGVRLAASHLGEEHAIGFQEYQRPSLDFVLAIAVASGKREHLERAWEMSMLARNQVTSIVAQRLATARAANDAKLAPVWRAWREASAAIARAELETGAGSAERHSAQELLDRAERALADAEMPFAAAAVEARTLAFADVRGALPAETALVLFVPVQPRVPSDYAKLQAEQRSPDLYALVLPDAKGTVRAIKLGTLEQASRRVDAWNSALGDRVSALADINTRGRDVRALLWDPLTTTLRSKRVFVLPSGALFRVPWPALPDGNGFLVEAGWTVHALNHERELLAPPLRPMGRLLAVADPWPLTALPALANACADAPHVTPALPGARREAEKLNALWRRHFAAADASLLLVGENATEARVRDAAPAADVLHFATHSVSSGGGCATATTRGFALVADTPANASTAPTFSTAALALASGDSGRSEDDGLLSAEEIATLDLSRVRWAVLAACATAAGATHHYEGLFGLSRAFRLAGARTVIMSLWPVDDDATAQWTEALYQARLAQGLDTAAAMSAAQRSMLLARRKHTDSVHPYFWAGFIAAGDWR
jgi:CHAT domain-containing protein